MKSVFDIEYADGTRMSVSIGIADFSAWERQPDGCASNQIDTSSRPLYAMTWLSWHSLVRRGDVAASYEEWLNTVESVAPNEKKTTLTIPPATPGRRKRQPA